MIKFARTVSDIRGISFSLSEAGQEFEFMCSIDGGNKFGKAYLQLPTTANQLCEPRRIESADAAAIAHMLRVFADQFAQELT